MERLDEKVLRPLMHTSKAFYAAVAVLLGLVGLFFYAWGLQLTQGLVVTGMRDIGVPWRGAAWGVYITNFIWWIGVAHGGIAMSAAVRLMRNEKYRPITRMAEVLTLVALAMAGMNIVFDVGRPDRLYIILLNYFDRIGLSPLVWDITVIFTYFILSASFFVLSLREDLAAYARHATGRLKRLYKLTLFGYDENEKHKIEQITWWLALAILAMITLLSGGMVAWIFGLIPAQPLWFGAFSGPYFLSGALASAVAAVILISAIARRLFNWQAYITTDVFRGLGGTLAMFTAAYLYMMLQEQIAVRYAGPGAELRISEALFTGQFAMIYWPVVLALLIPFFFLFAQVARPKVFNMKAVVISATVILVAFWVKRYIIVVPSMLFPRMPYPTGIYVPSFVEWSIVIGTFAIATLMFMAIVKIFPMMEVKK